MGARSTGPLTASPVLRGSDAIGCREIALRRQQVEGRRVLETTARGTMKIHRASHTPLRRPPIADPQLELDRARTKLTSSRILLEGTVSTQLFSELLAIRSLALQSSRLLALSASRTGAIFPAEYASAAVLARQAASMVGATHVFLGQRDGELTARQVEQALRQLRRASDVLGMAFIGAYTGTHP